MKNHLLLVAFFTMTLGCSSSGDGLDPVESTDQALGDPKANETRTTTLEIPITSETLINRGSGSLELRFPDLWRYTALANQPKLWFTGPMGEGCDDACYAKVLARAASRGGKLKGKLRVERKIYGIQKSPGVCAKLLEENVTLDLRAATHGIDPEVEEYYDFLTMGPMMPGRVELGPTSCSKG